MNVNALFYTTGGRSRISPGSSKSDPSLTPLSQLANLDDPNLTPLSQLGRDSPSLNKNNPVSSEFGRLSAMTPVRLDDPALTPLSQISGQDSPKSNRSESGRSQSRKPSGTKKSQLKSSKTE